MLRTIAGTAFVALIAYAQDPKLVFEVLTVGRNGPKMKETGVVSLADPGTPPLPQASNDGCPDLSAMANRPGSILSIANGNACIAMSGQTMSQLADTLFNQLDRPVLDMTGLEAKYSFLLRFDASTAGKGLTIMTGVPAGATVPGDGPATAASADTAPGIAAAVQQQLGLKLESRRGPVEMLVIDRVEKAPTEN